MAKATARGSPEWLKGLLNPPAKVDRAAGSISPGFHGRVVASSLVDAAICALTMKRKHLYTVAALILVCGLGYLISRTGTSSDPRGGAARADKAAPASSGPAVPAPNNSQAPLRSREPVLSAELVSKYGQARVNLSKRVAVDLLEFVDGFIEMKDKAADERFGEGAQVEAGLRKIYLGEHTGGLLLTDGQQIRLMASYRAFLKRASMESYEVTRKLKADASPLMERLLAMDALNRGAISEEESRNLSPEIDPGLTAFLNTMNPGKLNHDDVLADASFAKDFEGLLEPSQIAAFHEAREAQLADAAERSEKNSKASAGLDLEAAQEKFAGLKKMIDGRRQMREGAAKMRPPLPNGGR